MSRRDGEIPNTHEERAPSAATVERWPCGCPKGMTPHGVGWKDCIFSDEQKEKWAREASSAAQGSDDSLAGANYSPEKSPAPEPNPANGSELAVVTDGVVAVRDARLALRDASLAEIKELRDRAAAAETYAKAKEHREAYLIAGEIKLWAERAAGAIRKDMPRYHRSPENFDRQQARRLREQGLTHREIGERLGVKRAAISYAQRTGWKDGVPVKEFDESLGVSSASAYNWERIADIPEPRFAELIEESKERDGALTASGILRRDGKAYESRIAPGIYRLRDGRLSIRWSKDGVRRMKVLGHVDEARARAALAKARGTVKEPQVRVGYTVADAYSLVRRALQALDRLDSAQFDADAKKAVGRATAHLHKAEDELVIASSAVGKKGTIR